MNAEAHLHISGFINSFIEKRRRSSWESALLHKPTKAYEHLVKFERHLNENVCKEVSNPEEILSSYGNETCLYWQGINEPIFSAAHEVAELWVNNPEDTIVSFQPGKKVIFLFHEGWGWQCGIQQGE